MQFLVRYNIIDAMGIKNDSNNKTMSIKFYTCKESIELIINNLEKFINNSKFGDEDVLNFPPDIEVKVSNANKRHKHFIASLDKLSLKYPITKQNISEVNYKLIRLNNFLDDIHKIKLDAKNIIEAGKAVKIENWLCKKIEILEENHINLKPFSDFFTNEQECKDVIQLLIDKELIKYSEQKLIWVGAKGADIVIALFWFLYKKALLFKDPDSKLAKAFKNTITCTYSLRTLRSKEYSPEAYKFILKIFQ